MKRLIYVPIIHTSADLGSLAKDVTKRGIAGLGQDFWKQHQKTIDGFWKELFTYFNTTDVSERKIYQDGMVAEGEVGEKIIEEGVRKESKNHQLVSTLLRGGARLVKTEDIELLKKEHKRLLALTKAGSLLGKLVAFAKYKIVKKGLLEKRDEFIARRINETLGHSEEGILFIGADHNVKKKLPSSFLIIEVKNAEKVREYQKILPFCHRSKNRERFKELSKYLLSPVKV